MSVATLLIVEDNKTQQYVLQQLCERLDYDVHLVPTPEKALRALSSTQYAAVVLNFKRAGVPGMFEMVKQLRLLEASGSSNKTPVIALTMHTSAEDKLALREAGINDYMSKPFEPDDFRKMLLRWVYQADRPNLRLLQAKITHVDLNALEIESLQELNRSD